MLITAKYYLRHLPFVRDKNLYYNSISHGLDFKTGGHIFQLFFRNSSGINEIQVILFTTSDFLKGNTRFRFNLSDVFLTDSEVLLTLGK